MKMKLFSVAAASLALALSVTVQPAQASGVSNVHVTMLIPNDAGTLLFVVDTGRSTPPACATRPATHWAISTTTPAGQVMASTLLTALVSGLPIDIGGTNVCNVYGDAETAGYIAIHK